MIQIQIHILNVKRPLEKRTVFGRSLPFIPCFFYSFILELLELSKVEFVYAFFLKNNVICKVIYHFELQEVVWERCVPAAELFSQSPVIRRNFPSFSFFVLLNFFGVNNSFPLNIRHVNYFNKDNWIKTKIFSNFI